MIQAQGANPLYTAIVSGQDLSPGVARGVVEPDATVCGIMTGHLLKDPCAVLDYHSGTLEDIASNYAKSPIVAPADLDRLIDLVRG